MPQPARYFRGAEEEAEAAAKSEEAKAAAKSAVDFTDQLSKDARAASENQFEYSELRSLLESPDTQTGIGQEYLTTLRGLLTRAGFKDDSLKDQQAMEALLAKDTLNQAIRFLNGQGSVSEFERKQVAETALAAKKDKGALNRLLGLREAAATRSQAAEEFRLALEDQGMGVREQKKELARWFKDNPFGAFVGAYGGYDASAANSILTKKTDKK